MTDPLRSEPVARPATAAGAKAFVVTPFARLARAHAAGTMADAMVAAAFAGSLFFSLPADDARLPVLRYLVITMLPFSVLSPLVGPLMDRLRGGHRFVVLGTAVLRALLCYLLIGQIKGAGTGFFLLALCLLVCQKAYQVARSALVPTVVRSDRELVEANSKLSLISGLASFGGVLPAGILLKAFGPEWSIGLAMCTYLLAGALAMQIPRSRVASAPADATERHELRGAGIVMAGSAMGLLRACVGFLTLLVAFDFRGGGRASWEFGVVAGASVLSQLLGAAAAPRIRDHTTEENLLTGSVGVVVVGGFLSLLLGDLLGATILGSSVGFAAAAGKLAFDSILQRDAPDANRGRAFAKFETRFQVAWVIGALIPVAVTLHARLGFAMVLVVALVALGSYTVARLAYAHRMGTRQTAASAAAVGIEERFAEVSGEVKGRITKAPRAVFRRIRTGRTGPVGPDGRVTGAVPQPDGGGEPVLGDDPESWPQPEWSDDQATAVVGGAGGAGGAGTQVVDRGRRRGRLRRHRGDTAPTVAAPSTDAHTASAAEAPTAPSDLASGSPNAWRPPTDPSPYPWEPPSDTREVPGAFLADVDPSASYPYPWTPDDEATRAE